MPYSKRRIIEVYFDLENNPVPHPAIILSEEDIYNKEGYYLCVMISKTPSKDKYSFPLEKNDTTKPLENGSCVRSHIIFPIFDRDINKDTPINHLKEDSFNRLIDFIAEIVFGVPFVYE